MKVISLVFVLNCLLPGWVVAQQSLEVEPLHEAAFAGNVEEVRRLLEEGTAVDVVDPEGRTALMWASFNGHTAVDALLLEKGAAVNARETNGRTALMYASSGPFAGTVGLLLEKGADANLQGSAEGFTALMTAAAEGQAEVVRVLLAYGADPDLEDVDGDTAESFAIQKGHAQVVVVLRNPPPAVAKP
jgi:ankyrin repeat protein